MMGDQEESIEIRVDKISQLFDSLDPFPFCQRDLDSHADYAPPRSRPAAHSRTTGLPAYIARNNPVFGWQLMYS